MSVTIKAADLSVKLNAVLNKYGDDVTKAVARLVKKTGETIRDELKASSPRRTGAYAQGWTASSSKADALGASVVVHNRRKPQLTHLLERGHAKRGGGRVPARPHIEPVRERNLPKFEESLERVIGNV